MLAQEAEILKDEKEQLGAGLGLSISLVLLQKPIGIILFGT